MAYSKQQKKEILESIFERIAEKKESLRTILKDDDMPSISTFFIWIEENTTVDEDENEIPSKESKQYTHACACRAEGIFDEMIEIADDGTNDYMEIQSKGGNSYMVEDKEVTNRSKLRIETRKWVLGKMNPKKYSDKTIIEGGEKPVAIVIDFTD